MAPCIDPFGKLPTGAEKLGHQAPSAPFFDTVTLDVGDAGKVCAAAVAAGYNLRQLDASRVSVAFDETTTIADVDALLAVLNGGSAPDFSAESLASSVRLLLTSGHDLSALRLLLCKSSLYSHPACTRLHRCHSHVG